MDPYPVLAVAFGATVPLMLVGVEMVFRLDLMEERGYRVPLWKGVFAIAMFILPLAAWGALAIYAITLMGSE